MMPDQAAPATAGTSRPEPFLKWAGGKTQLLPQYEQFFPRRFHVYFEPFLGSGAVFFHLQPPRAQLNDSNPNLIAAYRHLQTRLGELLPLLLQLRSDYHALDPAEQQVAYYRMRARYNQLPSGDLEKSALLIVLNKTGFNGLYRENRRGSFNVPCGRYHNPGMFREDNLRAIARALQNAQLSNVHFGEAVASAQAGDFVYFDPPYAPRSKTSSFTSYTRGTFGPERHIALAGVVHRLARRGVLVMVSNSDTPLIRNLYRDYDQHEVRARRAINSKPNARGKINELVITSYTPGLR